MTTIAKRPFIAERIVFLDGLTGCGKTMMGPILGSFRRMQIGRLEHIYEYLCALDDLGKMDPQAAQFMFGMYTDLAVYNVMISRELNFRWTDLTSVFRNPNTFEYIKRLFAKDGNIVLERIRNEKPILQLISHQALGIMDLGFRTLGNRLRVVEMVRHPLYLLEHWYSYIDRHGTDSRDFTIWVDHQGKALPWFAKGWEEKYSRSGPMDRVIYSIDWLNQKVNTTQAKLNQSQRDQILTIPFEKFVLDPFSFIDRIAKLLDTESTRLTKQILHQQKCPRLQVAAGPNKEIYRRYGWSKPPSGMSEEEALSAKRDYAKKLASPDALRLLDQMSLDYEKQYGKWY